MAYPCDQSAPVDCSKIDLDANPHQHIYRYIAPSLVGWIILRRHAGDRLTRIAALRQRTFGGVELARTFEVFTALLCD